MTTAIFLLLAGRDAAAQPGSEGFFTVAMPSHFGLMLAGGGDGHIAGPVRAGAEAGWIAPHAMHVMPYAKLALGQRRDSRVTPFAIGGWVWAVAPSYGEVYQGMTYGAGIDLRNNPRNAAFRLEYVRMHLGRGRYTELWNLVRFGVAFR